MTDSIASKKAPRAWGQCGSKPLSPRFSFCLARGAQHAFAAGAAVLIARALVGRKDTVARNA